MPSESALSLYSNSVAVPELLPDVASVTNDYGKDNPRIAGYCLVVLQKIGEKNYGNKSKNKNTSLFNARITLDRFNQRVSE